MESLLISIGVVALAEIGDKTQLLSFVLAARYRRPWPIIAGILVATTFNHSMAGVAGAWIGSMLSPAALRWSLGLSFIAMALWILIPDRVDDADLRMKPRLGVFGTTLGTFFLAEMGDKTQIATVALGARFDSVAAVVAGTTIGMMLANVPAVFIGEKLAHRLPVRLVHGVAAVIFAAIGVATLAGGADGLL
ncbi:MAG: TMEM165/GDT1 family protein [Burkholderiaceae bacterium]